MNIAPNWQAADEIWASMRPLLVQLLEAPRSPRARGNVPALPGIYLFSDGERYRYVGQTRNLRARLGQHTRPSGTHYTATLAFLMAVEHAAAHGVATDGRARAMLQADPVFAAHFTRAKTDVASWDVQFIEVRDPLIPNGLRGLRPCHARDRPEFVRNSLTPWQGKARSRIHSSAVARVIAPTSRTSELCRRRPSVTLTASIPLSSSQL